MPYSAQSMGGSVKMVGDYTIKGTAIVFGGRDLVGDCFTPATDLGETRPFVGMPVYYDHALGNEPNQIGTVKQWETTEGGLDVEIELSKRYRYVEQVMELVKKGAIGLSTGAVGNTVVREKGQLKRWIVGELSLTTTPAEPRTVASTKTADAAAQHGSAVGNIDLNH